MISFLLQYYFKISLKILITSSNCFEHQEYTIVLIIFIFYNVN